MSLFVKVASKKAKNKDEERERAQERRRRRRTEGLFLRMRLTRLEEKKLRVCDLLPAGRRFGREGLLLPGL
jgi:hypothetical protein